MEQSVRRTGEDVPLDLDAVGHLAPSSLVRLDVDAVRQQAAAVVEPSGGEWRQLVGQGAGGLVRQVALQGEAHRRAGACQPDGRPAGSEGLGRQGAVAREALLEDVEA